MMISACQLGICVGLLGPNPGSELISQKNPYTTGPFGNSLWSAGWDLTQSSMGGVLELDFGTLEMSEGMIWSNCESLHAGYSAHFPTLSALIYSPWHSPNQGLLCFRATIAAICTISLSYTQDLTYLFIQVSYLCIKGFLMLYLLIQHIHMSSRSK